MWYDTIWQHALGDELRTNIDIESGTSYSRAYCRHSSHSADPYSRVRNTSIQ